ncbi:hypothetical protein SAMN04489724_0745 [Algoriphagus locisalis]|uniref:Uncharacterized protein n=1 Tax=Algoriphagus locisalis TaxID=305507 RepID=A0A1I6Y041_9BACT|nr:hypothetical protein [Algoriphagus locisalis]SFT43581.1 hypothetical protein SAMN04489724_0745 [Algoriphagus locisalis]
MDVKQTKYELQHIIQGASSASYDALIQTVSHYLKSGKRTGPVAEEKHQNKIQETARLKVFAKENQLFIKKISEEKFISSGAEQKVYIKGAKQVIKLNDAIYYASWEDYFHNLLLHNYFFSDTAYELLGFYELNSVLYAVVSQPYVKANCMTDLNEVKSFMAVNGFLNTRRHDYYHPDLGLIIEDLHDENVLTNDGLLYFIDTVFYIDPVEFWKIFN